MDYKITYTNWQGREKVWNVNKEGVFFVKASDRLQIGDGSFLNDSNLGIFQNAQDATRVAKLLRMARPDWADKIQAVKAPCVFDAGKTFIPVERWS